MGKDEDSGKQSQFAAAVARLHNSSGNLAASFSELRDGTKSPHRSRKPKYGSNGKSGSNGSNSNNATFPSIGGVPFSPEGNATRSRRRSSIASTRESLGIGSSSNNNNITNTKPRSSSRPRILSPKMLSPRAHSPQKQSPKTQSPKQFGSTSNGNNDRNNSNKNNTSSSTQSYIGRGSMTPKSAKKSTVRGFNGLPFTPSPSSNRSTVDAKRKAKLGSFSLPLVDSSSNGGSKPASGSITQGTLNSPSFHNSIGSFSSHKSGQDTPGKPKKHAISFQAKSPMQVKKSSAASRFSQYSGSYMGKQMDARPKDKSGKKPSRKASSNSMGHIADIKIEAKIPNVEKKLAERRRARTGASSGKYAHEMDDDDRNLPEAVRKFRQREKARLAALDEKQKMAEQKVYAIVIGWYRRKQYPKLRKANKERLRRLKAQRELEAKMQRAATKIQAVWRAVLPRKEFQRLINIKRRREKNKKRIKQIERALKNIPKTTKAELKEMKKDHAAKKKSLKKVLKDGMSSEEKKLQEIRKQGSNMIDYMQEENKRLREMKAQLRKETKAIDKETTALKKEADALNEKFQSLREFAQKKAQSVQKKEIASSKCRNRYLPKYRAELADRTKFCITEHRVKALYKARLHKIAKEIQARSKDADISSEVVAIILDCEADVREIPDVPMPPDLEPYLR